MGHSYEKSKKIALKTIILLAVITVVEVLIALLGKGYLIEGVHMSLIVMGFIMIVLSLTKAYYIVYEFMHMKYEVPGLVRSVLLPVGLLVWAVIAFFAEGNDWQKRRNLIKDKNEEKIDTRAIKAPAQEGMIKQMEEIKHG
ncbi:MAG: cytochrome C oxidase subunit IV family protein [Saprospiraceae bacterium]|nr:cytochrome C oxidase subunit IV family protein [Saprospiraceae bacterium]